MKKYSNLINKIVIILLVLFPFIDVITSIMLKNNVNFLNISTILRGLIFILITIYLYNKETNKKFIVVFILYFILEIGYVFIYTKNNVYTEFSNVLQIFYLPFLIYFFNKYENKSIDDKLITIIYFIYLNLILVPYILGIGNSVSEIYSNKEGYFGLFYSGNEVSAVLLGLLPVTLNYVINSKNYILKLLFYIELVAVTFIVGTKTLFIGVILILLILFIKTSRKKFKEFKLTTKIIFIVIPLISIFMVCIYLPKTSVYKNIKRTLDYYEIDTKEEILSVDFVDKVIYSSRLTFMQNINKEYSKQSIKGIIYGIGKDKILSIKDVEIDVFDIFFSIGIFGFIIWLMLLINVIKMQKLRGSYKLSFVLFILISLFSGHVLTKPFVSIYIAILFMLNKNNIKIEKKKILLVSNMYPSNKYKHYGSFVKNTKELLEDNNFIVDKSVMYKQDNIIGKIFSYLKLYIGTILKGIFNNYDYIYVHFISHSSFSAVFLKLTSKDIKLVLNAHGNDVVVDMPSDNKNVKRSKKYIKYADKIVVPSSYFKDVIVNDYNVDENKVFVYPSGGVDTDKFVKLDKDECKKNCNLDSKYKYIGYVSRIEKDKGWDIFLKAIKELEKEGKIDDKKFLIVGTGSEENEMNKLIKDLDILKYLEIRSMVSQDELAKIYNSLEIFVFPTYRKSESLGLVGLEAMSCETFVIASNNYGPTDYVRDNKNGFFFEPKNEVDLKNKILEYEKLNNEQKKKISKKMRETAVKYDVRNTKDKILEVFR